VSKESDPDAHRGRHGTKKYSSSEPVALRRVLLKITGESFSPPERLKQVAGDIAAAASAGCEIAVVVGGGNIMRGARTDLIDRIPADFAGMVGTIVNGIILTQLLKRSVPAFHLSAFGIAGVVPKYRVPAARAALARGQVLVLSGGTGRPLFSTDTAAAHRAHELRARAILKGTRVRGVYSADPEQHRNARFYPRLTYRQALQRKLAIMDAAAFSLCARSRIPIIVFDLFQADNLLRVVKGEPIGSKVC
jgi:uridylate kinase